MRLIQHVSERAAPMIRSAMFGAGCATMKLLLCAATTLVLVQSVIAQPLRFNAGSISGLPARNIGSATMSGRISALTAAYENGRLAVFVASASGGVWKSVNGGTTFTPVFDKEPVQSIGAIAVDPSNSKNVWVGTGESWVRNSVSIGDGVYRSTDGGENWANVGLKDSEHISKIIVDPKDGDAALVCSLGHLWSDGGDRGVYKTNDGGKSWRKVLGGTNPSTSCAMLASSLKEPNTIYASLWDFRREGWTFRSGGPGSGVFKSTDGGEHWAELTEQNAKGLPAKPYGRIALAVAPSKTDVVYAMIESAASALFRSDDGGATWKKLDASQYMIWRPFYFANLIVDPENENKIFKPDFFLLCSNDGGRSFSGVSEAAHGDFHDVWISPQNPNIIFAGDDGGLWKSQDGGTRWEHLLNLPISQFYHVSVDNSDPYHVYGGLQDNSSWVGDSSYPGGISNSRWENMYGGDGFWMFEDTADPNYIYAEAQGGTLGRVNRNTHETRSIMPYPEYGHKKLRFNWNTPIHMSPNEKGTIYVGAEYLFRSRDHGQSWDKISPDLTTNDPEKQKQEESGGVTVDNSSAEMHTSIYSISESPKNGKVIWVGTDDGNLQVTGDEGKNWTNMVGNVPGLAKNSWVSTIEASRFDQNVAYATFDRHTFGDITPYLYKTADQGKSWVALPVKENGVEGYAHVIKEDTKDSNLLFLGTEFGLWISVDGGSHWAQYKGSNFPAAAVRDIAVQAREGDLVLATHGRGIWVIDDISSLRSLTPQVLTEEAAFLPSRLSVQYLQANGGWPEGDGAYTGPARPENATITYYQRSRHMLGDMKIEIFDAHGTLVDSINPGLKRGVNRVQWSMRRKAPKVPPAASALFEASVGPRVLPGTYTVKMTKGSKVYTTLLPVALDPRATYSLEDRKVQYELAMKLYEIFGHMTWAVDALTEARDGAAMRASKLDEKDLLRAKLMAFAKSTDDLRSKIVATKEGGAITGEERIREFLGSVYGAVNGYEGRPTQAQADRAEVLRRELEDVIKSFNEVTAAQLAELNRGLKGKKLPPLKVMSEIEWQKANLSDDAGSSSEMKQRRFERD
jgi:photosystem II stability/assembly factor-like uncharacterized protein